MSQNITSPSFDENLYDIAISGDKLAARKKYNNYMSNRASSHSSLASLGDQKRPGEYYLSKLSKSAVNLPKQTSKRPNSDVSVSSGEASKDSDDASSVSSNPFDMVDSRLSSMTSNSVYSNRHSDQQLDVVANSTIGSIDEQASDDDLGPLSSSISTITLRHDDMSTASISDLAEFSPRQKPQLRAASTSNVLDMRKMSSKPSPKLTRQASDSSPFLLTRSKTRYYNAQETKERKQLRKKQYEDFEKDDELYSNDLDFVFNVPVIKNHGEIYRTPVSKSTPRLLSRRDIVERDDDKYALRSSNQIRPCPLPGRLTKSDLSVNVIGNTSLENTTLGHENSILEEDEEADYSNHSSVLNFDQDEEICHNISDFYSQRSVSYSKLARASREHSLTKLPNYVKAQLSLDDLSLISPEKLEAMDHTRPINLPPKASDDKARHSKELSRVFTDFESSNKQQNTMRTNLSKSMLLNQQAWLKLMTPQDGKDFQRKLNSEREKLRNLNWESPAPDSLRFEYFMKVLTLNLGESVPQQVRDSLQELEATYEKLSPQMKKTKDAEFEKIVDTVLSRPMYKNALESFNEHPAVKFDVALFKENFKHLLFLKTLSTGGLKKHHEIFVIPAFLIFFQSTQSFTDICVLIEMFDKDIFESSTFASLSKKLSTWKSTSLMSSSSVAYKILSKFNDLKEFEYLNAFTIFELIIQLDERLPLSLSAPSTPTVGESYFPSLSKLHPDADNTHGNEHPLEMKQKSLCLDSSSLSVIGTFLQLLMIYSRSKNKRYNYVNIYQSFLLTIFNYYHINWNSCEELCKENKSIRLNNTHDQMVNFNSFIGKWRSVFKKM